MNAQRFTVHERRRHERITAPSIAIDLDGRTYETLSWSLGGFIVEGYEGRLSPGALFTIEAIGTVSGKMAPVTVRARVVRFDHDKRSLVVNFLDLDDRAYSVLRECAAERARVLKDRQSV